MRYSKTRVWFFVSLMASVIPLAVVGGCGEGNEDPDVPVATMTTLAGTVTGEVVVAYSVADTRARLVNVGFFHGTSAAPQNPATAAATSSATSGLATSAAGRPYAFSWDTVADLGYGRTENVFLALRVTAGGGEAAGGAGGIGDETGPFVVDNTGLTPSYSITGDVCRSSMMQGTATGDLEGKLYLGLYLGSQGYPPAGVSLAGLDLGTHDLTNTSTCVPYSFSGLAPDNYQLIAVLDHDDDNLSPLGGFVIDAGDVTNASGTQVQIVSSSVQQNVLLNYYCTPPTCQ